MMFYGQALPLSLLILIYLFRLGDMFYTWTQSLRIYCILSPPTTHSAHSLYILGNTVRNEIVKNHNSFVKVFLLSIWNSYNMYAT